MHPRMSAATACEIGPRLRHSRCAKPYALKWADTSAPGRGLQPREDTRRADGLALAPRVSSSRLERRAALEKQIGRAARARRAEASYERPQAPRNQMSASL